MSSTLISTLLMAFLYFAVYLGVQVSKSVNKYAATQISLWKTLEQCLQSSTASVAMVPMLCVLFMGMRMRAHQFHESPQSWVQCAMFGCVIGVYAQVSVIILQEFFTDQLQNSSSRMMHWLESLRYLCMALVYAGFSTVLVGVISIEAKSGNSACPDCNWKVAPSVSPAVQNVVVLCFLYFGILLCQQILVTGKKFGSIKTEHIELLGRAFDAMKLAPMLGVLYIGTRMRALQLDPYNGNPPAWAQGAFYFSTLALCLQVFMVLLEPCFTGRIRQHEDQDGSPVHEVIQGDDGMMTILTFVRFFALMSLYGGVATIVFSLFAMEDPHGDTPSVSTAMLCVSNLIIQFFVVYTLLALIQSFNQIVHYGQNNNAQKILESCLPTLDIIPMMCVLFITVRMRTLELGRINPPLYCRIAMQVCAWTVLLQTILVLVEPLFSGELTDPLLGKPASAKIWFAKSVTAIRFMVLTSLYGCFGVVAVAAFHMKG